MSLRGARFKRRERSPAHATGLTLAERSNGPLSLPSFGDETALLTNTLKIIERLDLCVRGVSFKWDESEGIARRNAEALWQGTTIKVHR